MASDLAVRFMSLFSGLDRAHGIYDVSKEPAAEGIKQKGKASTAAKPVTAKLWSDHLAGRRGLGIIPLRDDATVLWAAIDVDRYPLDLVALDGKIEEHRLPLQLVRSKSGGAHLYLFLTESIPAKWIRAKLSDWAAALGHPGVEIFPKQDEFVDKQDIGNWINMPYFNAADTVRYGLGGGIRLTAEEFLEQAEAVRASCTRDHLDKLRPVNRDVDPVFQDGPPCLEKLCTIGFPAGSRNKGLFNIGVLLHRKGYDDWEQKLEELNRKYMQPPMQSSEVMQTIKSFRRKNYGGYTCKDDPIRSQCNRGKCLTRDYGVGTRSQTEVPAAMVERIEIVGTRPAYFNVWLTGQQSEIRCLAKDLLSPLHFRERVLEVLHAAVAMPKADEWLEMVNIKLAEARKAGVTVPPADADAEGQLMDLVEEFCTGRVQADSIDGLTLGQPYRDEEAGVVLFRGQDLRKFLHAQRFSEIKWSEVWAIIKRHGGVARQPYQSTGKKLRAWCIPDFPRQTKPYRTPKVDDDDED
jgi:Primase C terminal 1 (PriCT-1)